MILQIQDALLKQNRALLMPELKGIEESSGKYIAFFDDDNEPYTDYLVNLKKLHVDYPTVAAWGPGNIWVDFVDGLDKSVNKSTQEYVKSGLFQERHEKYTLMVIFAPGKGFILMEQA